MPYFFAREVDADSTLSDQVRGHLVLVTRDARDNDVADGQTLLKTPAFQILNVVLLLLEAASTAETLHTGDIDGEDLGTIVCKKSCKWTANDLAAVDDSDAASEQTLAVVQEGVVDTEMFQNLDASQRCAGKDRLLEVVGRVEETDVLVHVANQLWRETLDILVHADGPLESAVAL